MKAGVGMVCAAIMALLLPALATAVGTEEPKPEVTLLSVDTLRLERDSMTILDARPQQAYLAGHIPGAYSLDVDALALACLSGTTAEPARVAAALAQLPLQPNRRVLVYASTYRTRRDGLAAWLLALAGVPHVTVLDGGFPAWNQRKRLGVYQGYPGRMAINMLRPEHLTPRPWLRDLADMTSDGEQDKDRLIRVLPAGCTAGPGAISVSEVLDTQGAFIYPEELETLLAEHQLPSSGRLLLTGKPEDTGLAWVALTGNGFQASIIAASVKEEPAGTQP